MFYSQDLEFSTEMLKLVKYITLSCQWCGSTVLGIQLPHGLGNFVHIFVNLVGILCDFLQPLENPLEKKFNQFGGITFAGKPDVKCSNN